MVELLRQWSVGSSLRLDECYTASGEEGGVGRPRSGSAAACGAAAAASGSSARTVVGAAEVEVVVPRRAGTPGRGRSSGRSGPGSRWPKPGAQAVGGVVEAAHSGRCCTGRTPWAPRAKPGPGVGRAAGQSGRSAGLGRASPGAAAAVWGSAGATRGGRRSGPGGPARGAS